MSQYPYLLSSVKIGSLEFNNRIAMAPMTRARSGTDRIPNDLMATYYQQRASAGLIITEATSVSQQGLGWPQTPGIYTEEMTEGWKKTTRAVHQAGGKIFLQLWHCGRASHSSFHDGEPPVAPSAIKIEGDSVHTDDGKKPYEVPRALETSELSQVVDDYRLAALRAKDAGFDGVEIHSANGYLLDQFLQSKSNHRTDAYGGSVENRYRLLGEVTTAVCDAWSADRVAVRLAPNGAFNDMGSPDYREQFSYVARQLNQFGLAYLHIMDGLGFGFHKLGEPMTLKEFRGYFDGPLMGNCGYKPEEAEKRIAEGDADMIAIGRPYMSNPDYVERLQHDWPLTNPPGPQLWYSHAPQGYADFPSYQQQS